VELNKRLKQLGELLGLFSLQPQVVDGPTQLRPYPIECCKQAHKAEGLLGVFRERPDLLYLNQGIGELLEGLVMEVAGYPATFCLTAVLYPLLRLLSLDSRGEDVGDCFL